LLLFTVKEEVMLFENMSKEAQKIAVGMIENSIEQCRGMGMDEGKRKNGQDRSFLVQLKKFVACHSQRRK
jgi:hypothetical protein